LLPFHPARSTSKEGFSFGQTLSSLRFRNARASVDRVKVLLVIPMLYYKVLVEHSAVLWPEYPALKNGILVHDIAGDQIQILCDPQRVELIMNFAARACAEAIPHIQQIIDWLV
jgi:hypothetical protein